MDMERGGNNIVFTAGFSEQWSNLSPLGQHVSATSATYRPPRGPVSGLRTPYVRSRGSVALGVRGRQSGGKWRQMQVQAQEFVCKASVMDRVDTDLQTKVLRPFTVKVRKHMGIISISTAEQPPRDE